jgi:hypothetical protein
VRRFRMRNYIDKESGLVEVASEEFDDYFVFY